MATIDVSAVGVVGAVVAAGSAVTGWIAARSQNRKAAAEAESVMVSSAERLVGMLNAQMESLRVELVDSQRRCEEEVRGLKLRIASLERVITGAGMVVPPQEQTTQHYPRQRRRPNDRA